MPATKGLGPAGNTLGRAGSTQAAVYLVGAPHESTASGKHVPVEILGLAKGELFTRTTAHDYTWHAPLEPSVPWVAVEAGVNDRELDAVLQSQQEPANPPVIELSRADLVQHVHLVQGGLLGRGATALVFQCVWPSRFGPNALLAAKDGHEVDPLLLQSFAYEANVLANTEHPCVVRLYGYCLEPPTVCLILELLPYSLKDLLYGVQPNATLHPAAAQPNTTSPVPQVLPKSLPPAQDQPSSSPAPSAVASTNSQNRTDIESSGVNNGNTSTSHSAYGAASCKTFTDGKTVTGLGVGMTSTSDSTHACTTIGKASPLNMLQVLRISTDIAAGLAYLHDRPLMSQGTQSDHAVLALQSSSATTTTTSSISNKITHRDLKPANILINSVGRAKISDFGLARQTPRTTLLTECLGAGTLPYMAPELLAAANAGMWKMAPTNRVDIYSLSMIMWEMLSGTPPWSEQNTLAVMAAVIRNQRPPLGPTAKDLADTPTAERDDLEALAARLDALPEFNQLIRACWNHREHKRPTAAAVFSMLTGMLATAGQQVPLDLLQQAMQGTVGANPLLSAE